uniref:Peptidyl-prolyl cis-trans isomerase n=1 Tax=Sinocyclocheilus rhinocerous TaxID=307959 RepID=A0A673LNJ9_9TELE
FDPFQITKTNPLICYQLTFFSLEVGRMKIELFADIVPKTAENFRKDGVPVGYKVSIIHCYIDCITIFSAGDGTGICSIYRGPFADENFRMKQSGPGLLSMANSGPGTNGCQFFITCTKCDWLDGKHVVFGKVVDGLLVMRKIEVRHYFSSFNVPTGPNNKPKLPIVVAQCGEM